MAGSRRRVRAHAVRLDNLRNEVRLGISTRGMVDVDHPDSAYYATMSYPAIRRVLRGLALRPTDVFVDIGCGKGRVLCCAARHPVDHVVGVDISADLCAAAEANARRLRGRRSPITVHNVPAHEFDYSRGTVFFLFNPFGAATLDHVLTKIRDDTRGRAVRLAYAVPTHRDVVARHRWLRPWARPATADWLRFYRAGPDLGGPAV
jgi:cyclopropane fatty-acyl-phospholipid synthase-like methyltransferase